MGNHLIRALRPSVNGAGDETFLVAVVAGAPEAGDVDGSLSLGRLRTPHGVTVDAAGTTVFIADTGNHKIRRLDVISGALSTLAGSGAAAWGDGVGAAASFHLPVGLAFLDVTSALYVAESGSPILRSVTTGVSPVVSTLAGQPDQSGLVDGLGGAARCLPA